MPTESKFVVLTGASRGLGRAMTAGFIESGHTVAGCSRSLGSVKHLESEFGEPHQFDCVDVCDDEQVRAWATAVIKKHGPPDLLVNNAAVINENAPLWDVPAGEFSDVIDINIKGVANVIRHFVPSMVNRNSGIVVNFSSGWGRSTSPDVAPYCATKWAIEGLTQAMAQELPEGMAAIPLNPGVINTEMLQSCFGHGADDYPNAEQWSKNAVPFLLSLTVDHNGEPLTVPL